MRQILQDDVDGVCERIVTAVAALEDTDPAELPPLFDAVDPDALTAVFSTTGSGTIRTGRVEFPYAGYWITVEFDDGAVVTVDSQ